MRCIVLVFSTISGSGKLRRSSDRSASPEIEISEPAIRLISPSASRYAAPSLANILSIADESSSSLISPSTNFVAPHCASTPARTSISPEDTTSPEMDTSPVELRSMRRGIEPVVSITPSIMISEANTSIGTPEVTFARALVV